MRYSNSSYEQPKALDPTIREIDYLCYLNDEYKEKFNSTFETDFVPSCIAQLRAGKRSSLSQKQEVSLRKMVDKYIEKEDYEWLKCGYADRTDTEVMNNKGPGTASTKLAQANDDDGYEDDIPF